MKIILSPNGEASVRGILMKLCFDKRRQINE